MTILEPTPEPKGFVCKVLVVLVTIFLMAFPWILAIFTALKYHWSVGIGFWVFGYLVTGIISSKMRQISIPNDQKEISFSSNEISRWFISYQFDCR
ncbi:MAG: hypothetical protein M0P02_05050 [Sulfurospirillaceae bacterium]|jgi:hypothetical protein|nr:hypothetical protein [Sulfurospirillaceae bacterium]MCK9545091.1 hypothetical protein [Sulfurospirillaceae bacterium]MDY0238486.1 hypothetical protein [Campylobacterales bacterium]NLN00036.1 hypothetical protein [Campylobacteraceae bacterium]